MMTTKEFTDGLYKLAEQHKNDKRTIFDTDWEEICKEAANYILELQRQIDEMTASNESWVEWYEKERMKEKEKQEEKHVETIPFVNPIRDLRREEDISVPNIFVPQKGDPLFDFHTEPLGHLEKTMTEEF